MSSTGEIAPDPATPQELEARADRARRNLTVVILCVLLVLVIANGVIDAWLIRSDAVNNEAHRRRNETIHACIVTKEDAFRRDVYRLLQTPPGAKPMFPEYDGISCPAIRP